MKKIITILLFIFVFSLVSPVIAKEGYFTEKTSNGKAKNLVALDARPAIVSTKAADLKLRVRNAINARWIAYDKLIVRADQLLDKIQIRIDRAKTAEADVKNSDALMLDARARLTDAKQRMDSIKNLTGTEMDKNSFRETQKNLQAVHKDLNIVKQDAAKIISNLKAFNSSTRFATKSASVRY